MCTCSYNDEEVEEKVSTLRASLSNQSRSANPHATETHLQAEATELKNQQLRNAFGIREDYTEGSAFNREAQALRAAQARAEREEKAE